MEYANAQLQKTNLRNALVLVSSILILKGLFHNSTTADADLKGIEAIPPIAQWSTLVLDPHF
jgi:hypothetical protein